MQRKNDSTILILVAAGLGIYYYMRNKSSNAQPLVETGFPPGTGTSEGALLDISNPIDKPLAETGFPPGTGSNFDMVYEPVGRGGGYMTDMFESILDTTNNIDKDRMYEK